MTPYATTLFSVLLTTSPTEDERQRLARKLRKMCELSRGWSYGEGEPITALATAVAERYVTIASQLNLHADVFPNPDGGCAVAFYQGSERVEVGISADGTRLALRAERGIGYEFENVIDPVAPATPEQVYKQILELLPNELWTLHVPSTYASTNLTLNVFEMSYTRTPQLPATEHPLLTAAGGSQSLKPLVPATL
jgi:hypothetical protein